MKVSEIFYSIEGEGIAIGKPQVFIRLTACNLRCTWCDTKSASDNGKLMTADEIITQVSTYPCKNVSITGGEPLLQKQEVLELVTKLKSKDFWIQLNTNGTIFNEDIFRIIDLLTIDCKCPSSMMKSDVSILKNVKESFDQKSQLKFVIANDEDFEYAEKMLAELNFETSIFQPEWRNKKYAKKIVEKVKTHSINTRIIIQQHKVIWGNKKGK